MILGLPKKTFYLIVLLFAVVVILFYVALRPSNNIVPPVTNITPSQAPVVSMAKTVISLSPNPYKVASAAAGSIVSLDVNIDTGSNKVSGVQLEISYDPAVFTSVTLSPGDFLPTATPLINKSDSVTGSITYGLVLPLGVTGKRGAGVVAKITGKLKSVPVTMTKIAILPTSKVTASGISPSVLLKATGADILFTKTP